MDTRQERAQALTRKALGDDVDLSPGTTGHAVVKLFEEELKSLDELRAKVDAFTDCYPGITVPEHDIHEQGGTKLECPSCNRSDHDFEWSKPFDRTGPEPINTCACGYRWKWKP